MSTYCTACCADKWCSQVMTSFHPEGVTDYLVLIASTTVPQDDGLPSRLRLRVPRSAAYFTGTGTREVFAVISRSATISNSTVIMSRCYVSHLQIVQWEAYCC